MKDKSDKNTDLDALVHKAFISNNKETTITNNSTDDISSKESIDSALKESTINKENKKKPKSSTPKANIKKENLASLIEESSEQKPHELSTPPHQQKPKDNLNQALKENASVTSNTKKSRSAIPQSTAKAHNKSVDELSHSTWTHKSTSTDKPHTQSGKQTHKNNYIFSFKGFAIVIMTAAMTLSIIYYMTEDLVTIVQPKHTPYEILKEIDQELINYQQEKNALPESLEILISFPENAVQWPMKYKSIKNIEGKSEILISTENNSNYTLYYRNKDITLMKPRGMPIRKIEQIP